MEPLKVLVKVTLPVGTGWPAAVPKVRVKVSSWPKTAGFVDEVRLAAGVNLLTIVVVLVLTVPEAFVNTAGAAPTNDALATKA